MWRHTEACLQKLFHIDRAALTPTQLNGQGMAAPSLAARGLASKLAACHDCGWLVACLTQFANMCVICESMCVCYVMFAGRAPCTAEPGVTLSQSKP